jgi:hypothetical protein
MYTKGGNLKKTSKAQLKRLVEALGDKAVQKLVGMGAVGDMLKQTAANTYGTIDYGSFQVETELLQKWKHVVRP